MTDLSQTDSEMAHEGILIAMMVEETVIGIAMMTEIVEIALKTGTAETMIEEVRFFFISGR